MGEVIAFPRPAERLEEIDLLTAVDCAIRDLRDIARLCSVGLAQDQANDCRQMLERAFAAALREA
jgi:hypothetical protein